MMKDSEIICAAVNIVMILGIFCALYFLVFVIGIPIGTSVETHKVIGVDINSDAYGYIVTLDTGELITLKQLEYSDGYLHKNVMYRMKLIQNLFWEYRTTEHFILDFYVEQ